MSCGWRGGLFCIALVVLCSGFAARGATQERPRPGPQGEESEALRAQSWLVPSGAPQLLSHATLFRPPGAGPFPLALIAHASTESPLQRALMKPMRYEALAAFFVRKGYAVIVPERAGHGATGGPYLEAQGGCVNADYIRAGYATADAIQAAFDFMRQQSFIKRDGALVVGHSAGGWGALALAPRIPAGLAQIIVFAPGRGGRAEGMANAVCAPDRLIAAAGEFGRTARVPVTWLVAENDSYFSPVLSKAMADAFASGGAKVDFRVLPAHGSDGHTLAEAKDGGRLWGDALK